MRLLTMATLAAAYVLMGLVTAVLLWQAGGGWGAGLAAAIGVLGLFVAFHALVSSSFGQAELKLDVGRIRDANLIFAEELEKTQLDVTKLSTLMHEEKAKRSQMARPMPRDPPVTMAVLPDRSNREAGVAAGMAISSVAGKSPRPPRTVKPPPERAGRCGTLG